MQSLLTLTLSGILLFSLVSCANSDKKKSEDRGEASEELNSAEKLKIGTPCGGDYINFGFINPPEEDIGKQCGYIGGIPLGINAIVERRVSIEGEKNCAQLGLKAGDPCPKNFTSCYVEYEVNCYALDQTKLKVAQSLECNEWPKEDKINCPISKASAKNNINYLNTMNQSYLANSILNLKLATYEYKPNLGETPGPQLGFIIDDTSGAPFVIQDSQRVNLYSYISAVAATVQLQNEKIKQLETELDKLRKNSKP